MSAIGVLAGDETGFRPADTLKRSEGAKIVAYLMLGNKTAEAMQGSGAKFTDLPANHWAAGYMEYLASVGVMGGVGDNKIDPDGQLTGTQFAKMLLTALGYDAEIEGFVGTDWAINTQKVANQVGIFDGNRAVVGSAAVTREEAALYAFNTLKAPIVEYDSTVRLSTVGGDILTVGNNKAQKVTTTKGSDQTISWDEEDAGHYYVEFAERYYPDLVLESRSAATGDYELDDFGRPSRRWSFNKVAIDTYSAIAGLVNTYTKKVSQKDLYDLFGKNAYDNLTKGETALVSTIDGVRQNQLTVGNVTYDYVSPAIIDSTYMNRNNTSAVNGTANGVVTEVYMDEDSNIYLATYHTWVFQAVADYDSAKDSIALTAAGDTAINLSNRTLKSDDFEEIKDFKADDYILVTATVNSSNANLYDVQTVAKAELLTGTVDTYTYSATTAAGSNVTLDGVKKEYNATAGADTKNNNFTIGQKATVVLDKYGYIIAVDEALVLSDYVFISDFANTTGLNTKAVAAATFTDGTTAEINLKSAWDYAGTAQVTSKATIGGWGVGHEDMWYTYSKNSSNEYTLYAIETGYTQAAATYTYNGANDNQILNSGKVAFINYNSNGATTASADRSGILANDKTVLVLTDKNDKVTVYEGVKNLPGVINAGTTALLSAVYKNNFASVAYLKLNGDATITGAANDNLIYIRDQQNRVKTTDQEVYYNYRTIGLDGTAATVQGENVANVGANTWFVANYASKDQDGMLVDLAAVTTDGGSVVAGTNKTGNITWSNGALYMDNRGFTLADDAQILLVKPKVGNVATTLNTDANADYEVLATKSGKALVDALNGYRVTYDYAGRATEVGGTVLKELYVTIKNVTVGAATTSSDTSGILAVIIPDDLATGGAIKVYYAGTTAPTFEAVQARLATELDARGIDVASVKVDSGSYKWTLKTQTTPSVTYTDALTYAVNNTNAETATDLSGTWAAGTNVTGNLVVQAGKTLTISSGNLQVTGDIIADGAIVVKSGATLTINGAHNLYITAKGDVTVETGGTFTGTAAAGTVKYGSTSLVVNGAFTIANLEVAGDVTVGGTANVNVITKITVKDGGAVVVSGTATVGTATLAVDGGSVTLSAGAKATATVATTVAAGANITIADSTAGLVCGDVSGTGTVTDATGATKTAAAVTEADLEQKKLVITINNWGDIDFNGPSDLTGAVWEGSDANTYYINDDTVTVKIHLIGSTTGATATTSDITVDQATKTGSAGGSVTFSLTSPTKASNNISFAKKS